jgi:thioredoxin-like negative regulator of GroEL
MKAQHVPTVGDEDLRALVKNSSTAVANPVPVAVLFLAGDQDRMWLASKRFERVAQDRRNEARVIMVQLSVAENPTVSDCWMNVQNEPEVIGFRNGEPVARCHGDFTTDAIRKLIDAVLAYGRIR